jgi:hypothetical protein
MSTNKIRIFLFFIIIVSIISFCCDLFKTRTPEEPSVSRSSNQPPTSSEIVLENLKYSISEKNTLNYIQCFAGGSSSSLTFTFIPAPDVQKQFLSIFTNWDINSEKSYFENLRTQSSKYAAAELVLNGSFTFAETDSMIYNADYTLTFKHDLSNVPQTATGNLQFVIRRDQNNNWSITRWIDNKVNNQFCWSEMKARFSS